MLNLTKIAELTKEHLLGKINTDLKCLTGLPVTNEQIQLLQKNGNYSENWKNVFVTEETNIGRIRKCEFSGKVYIHLPDGELQATSFYECKLEAPLLISSTAKISGIEIHTGVIIENCGVIRWTSSPMVLVSVIDAGVETGERAVPILPVLDHNAVAYLASAEGRADIHVIEKLQLQLKDSLKGVIAEEAVVKNTGNIENTVISRNVQIDNAGVIRDSILFANSCVQDGALVRNSVLQWNAVADSYAIVESSIVGEGAEVERHGKLTNSFLGADSVLGEGEVTASVVGPLTGIHHQCLLIAALWPGGLGNIGYGANIGSNHTSRLPDQEIRPGTGFFFGLSTSVKFPSDFTESPFSVIATGITTLPQKLTFPFSLITLPHNRPAGVPEAYCMLKPGWMLQYNLYALFRNAWKYKNRSKALYTRINSNVFSEEITGLVQNALANLSETEVSKIPGIGKNFVTEIDRESGIDIYRKYLTAINLWNKYSSDLLSSEEKQEFLQLIYYAKDLLISSREKDFIRGNRIIDDYTKVREPLENDEFIRFFDSFVKTIIENLQND